VRLAPVVRIGAAILMRQSRCRRIGLLKRHDSKPKHRPFAALKSQGLQTKLDMAVMPTLVRVSTHFRFKTWFCRGISLPRSRSTLAPIHSPFQPPGERGDVRGGRTAAR
jgi:hypothetical protein